MKRVNTCTVPDYSDNESGEFHYVSSERIANGDFCEKFSLKNANVLSDARKTNDFCPRAQLNKLLECCGKPELSRESVACEDGSVKVTPVDSNNTMDKVLGALGFLTEQFTGEDLRLYYKGRSYQRSKETSRTQVKSGNAKATEKLWHDYREIW